jgi:hypothetical protein
MLKRLIEDADALIKSDRDVVKALVESDFDNLPNLIAIFRDNKINVQAGLSRYPVIEGVDEEAIEVLNRVQRKFPTDDVIKSHESGNDDNDSILDLSDSEIWDLGSDLFYSWISHYEYVRNLFKLNTLILRTAIPPPLMQYISEVRNCYALEQYNATISMCRTILEAAAKDLCEKKGYFSPYAENVIEINPKIFNQLIRAISSGKLKREILYLYYREACPVIHGDRTVDSDDALRVLRHTTRLVQNLYSLNGH